ncbi:MAG: T9SS type A sorting domain-containing protein [Crocinitomicaceae bacterium]|nr:T9SS type A sorting domain-containing protein [Crocinitomicaceae bacterium]MCF8409647.1 T9SS type A sorting domain-containing protein [Crocinitomicaceae bacterium]MCF8443402.1 T9SS type A sorting domain-containing protein [Crocinitomicaceae bacterium]
MKKLLLAVSVILSASWADSQVIVAGVTPQSIVANYAFTWAEPASWGATPDFNIPGVFVEDTIMLVEDGSTGLNAQGFPVSQEGCNPLTNNLTGKIAVIYRNTCNFSLKALNAQNAGAVGVIIINRDPEVVGMGAGTDAPSVTIPVVMLTNFDGATLVNEMANGPVVVFMGNKTGLFANDIAIKPGAALAPKAGHVHSLLAQNGTEFNFDLGARIYNPGSAAQATVSLNAKITNPSGTVVYDNTVSGLSIISGDSTDVYPGTASTLPNFSLSSYPAGTYTVTYTAILGGTDEYDGDNTLTYTFTVNDSVFSYAKRDAVTNSLNAGNFYRPGTNTSTFSICTVINDANASRVAATGVYFAATKAANTDPLDGEEILLYLYKWEDAFTDLNDPNFSFNTLTEVASGFYIYPGDLQGEIVYGSYSAPVILTDNERYLACAQTTNLDLYLGYDDQNYTWNTDYYLQPMFPNESDISAGGQYFAVGFGSDLPTALGIGLIDKNSIGLAEANVIEGVAYPNPAIEKVTVSIQGEGVASLTITDVAGKVAMVSSINLVNGKSDVNIAGLEAGIYVFNVVLENGKSAQFNVVKK